MPAELYVGNLDPGTSGDEVRRIFEAAGCRPKQVRLVRDPVTGRRRGFGYVTLESEGELAEALERLEGTALAGRRLSLQPTPGPARRRFVGERAEKDRAR